MTLPLYAHGHLLLVWPKADNDNVRFWLTLQSYNYFATAPVLVFFLSLDRCLALKLQLLYGIWIRKFTALAAGLIALMVYCFSVGSFVLFKLTECKDMDACDILKYSAKPTQPQILCRLSFSTANFALCLYFLWLTRHAFRKRSVKNSVVKFALVTELCCSVIPTYFGYVFLTITGESAIKYLGIYSNTLVAVDAAICGLYFLKMLSKRDIVVQTVSMGHSKQ
ncbi:hypothetical protein DdX_14679 [Ditylenchus destructor]|uniref:Uncharacterized protein n=1 Tax=Ditylenchus destructor TaxID=166010 RepID=A0AAD4MSS5_9BILA|nr:hypothetical protein DdX_14679 [Ditylenchus destructor]